MQMDFTHVEEQMRLLVNEHFHQAPFFIQLHLGNYSYEQIRYFAIQYNHYSRHFPRVLGAAISALEPVDEWWIPLADNLWDEAGRGVAGRSHAALYSTFLLSVDPEIELNAYGLPVQPMMSEAVKTAVNTFIEFFRSSTPLQAMAAVGLGSEFFAGEVMGSIGRGLLHPNYNAQKKLDVKFWTAHADEHEPHHYHLCKTVLEQFTEPAQLREMLEVGAYIAKSEAKMYDQLNEEMMRMSRLSAQL